MFSAFTVSWELLLPLLGIFITAEPCAGVSMELHHSLCLGLTPQEQQSV